jgi:excisionase family DNA binding protein
MALDRNKAEDLVKEGMKTVEQAADFLGLGRSKLYALMETGELTYVKFGKARRIPQRALVDYAVQHLIPARAS